MANNWQKELDWVSQHMTEAEAEVHWAPTKRAWNRLVAARENPDKFWSEYNSYKEKAKKLEEDENL